MFNEQYVRTMVRIDQIHAWTRAQVRQELVSAAENQESEAMQMLVIWLDGSIKGPLASIKQFLGDDPSIDGGSIGEPIAQPAYARVLRESLHEKILEAGEMYYCPPPSPARTNIECLTDWIWICAVDR